MKKITYYDILGVSQNATISDIKNAYRKKAKEIHPDLNRNLKNASQRMMLLNKAHQTLTDLTARQSYDIRIAAYFSKYQNEKKQKHTTSESDSKSKTYSSYSNKTSSNNTSGNTNHTSQKARSNNLTGKNIFYIVMLIFFILSSAKPNKTVENQATSIPTLEITPIDFSATAVSPTGISVSKNPERNNSSRVLPAVTSEPIIDCTGPDGKHLNTTQRACDDFNNAWKPTAVPTGKQSYYNFYQSNDCGSCGSNSHCSYGYCSCDSGYKKNYSNGQCEKVDCPSNSHESYGSCLCDDGFKKNYSTNQCEKVECPPNSYQSYGYCYCNSGFVKNYSTGQCNPI